MNVRPQSHNNQQIIFRKTKLDVLAHIPGLHQNINVILTKTQSFM